MQSLARRSGYLITIILLLASLAPRSADALDLDSLLIASAGGPDAFDTLRNVESYRVDGNVTLNGQPGDFTMYFKLPDLFRIDLSFAAFSMTQAYDGRTAWQRDFNGQVAEMSGFEREELLNQIYLQSFSYLFEDRMPGSTAYVGVTTRDGDDYHEVLFMPFNEDTIRVFLDIETGRQELMIGQLDNLTTRTHSSDYRRVSGVLMAFRSVSEVVGMPVTTEFVVKQVDLHASLHDSLFLRDDASVTDFHFPDGADSVIIPIKFRDGLITLDIVLNGRAHAIFILDSGASSNLIDRNLAEKLQLAQVGSITARGMAGHEEVGLVRPDSMAIGALTLYNQVGGKMNITELLQPMHEQTISGLLGYDFLSRFPIKVDYGRQRLIVYRPDAAYPTDNGIAVPFTLTMKVPTVHGQVAGFPGDFLVDLGNVFGVVLHPHFVEETDVADHLSNRRQLSGTMGGVGGQTGAATATVDRLELGPLVVDDVPVVLPEAGDGLVGSRELAGNIGNAVLKRYAVLFDYVQNVIIFYPDER
ncbi:hypothetical protein GF420_09455 [candidate division GN15 bacterium]|nr:hypothetical protein [candidate division GN15 bacterium]